MHGKDSRTTLSLSQAIKPLLPSTGVTMKRDAKYVFLEGELEHLLSARAGLCKDPRFLVRKVEKSYALIVEWRAIGMAPDPDPAGRK